MPKTAKIGVFDLFWHLKVVKNGHFGHFWPFQLLAAYVLCTFRDLTLLTSKVDKMPPIYMAYLHTQQTTFRTVNIAHVQNTCS